MIGWSRSGEEKWCRSCPNQRRRWRSGMWHSERSNNEKYRWRAKPRKKQLTLAGWAKTLYRAQRRNSAQRGIISGIVRKQSTPQRENMVAAGAASSHRRAGTSRQSGISSPCMRAKDKRGRKASQRKRKLGHGNGVWRHGIWWVINQTWCRSRIIESNVSK